MGFDIIAFVFKNLAGETLVDRFDFLQYGDVRLRFIDPVSQRANTGFDAIDVECRDFHMRPLGWSTF